MENEDNLDLMMFPGDGQFEPYDSMRTSQPTAKTNGRIFSLKFSSSSQRHLFWLQSKAQGPANDPSFFSKRDLTIGKIVDKLLQGEDVNIEEEVAQARSGGGSGGDDEDDAMEDVEEHGDGSHHRGGSGGAGPDATGGDVREEGSSAREGGADGGRA
jgi:26S proteasome regulatory subunit N13